MVVPGLDPGINPTTQISSVTSGSSAQADDGELGGNKKSPRSSRGLFQFIRTKIFYNAL
jgi:hypothetical protein